MPQESKKRGRRLNVLGRVWQWSFSDPLCIWDPNDKRYEFRLSDLFGFGVHRDMEKRNFALKPRQIRDIIYRNILGYSDVKGFSPGILPDDFVMGRREGYEMLAGPRGKWQIKVAFMSVHLISPEGFQYERSVTDVFGEEWMTLLRDEINRIYPTLLKVDGESADGAWRKLSLFIDTPSINYQAAREYLRANYGEVAHA